MWSKPPRWAAGPRSQVSNQPRRGVTVGRWGHCRRFTGRHSSCQQPDNNFPSFSSVEFLLFALKRPRGALNNSSLLWIISVGYNSFLVCKWRSLSPGKNRDAWRNWRATCDRNRTNRPPTLRGRRDVHLNYVLSELFRNWHDNQFHWPKYSQQFSISIKFNSIRKILFKIYEIKFT